jgi:hypothetical protein
LLSQVPKSAQPWVATLLRTVFEQPHADAIQAQMRHVLDALEAKFPKAAAHLDSAQHELLAFTAFPREIWRQIWSYNGRYLPRPHRPDPPRRRGPGRADRRVDRSRRYMGLDLLAEARLHPSVSETDGTGLPAELTA